MCQMCRTLAVTRHPGTLRLDKQNVVLVNYSIFTTQQSVSDIRRLPSHAWLCIPGLLFIEIPYKLVFSYQTKAASVSTTTKFVLRLF